MTDTKTINDFVKIDDKFIIDGLEKNENVYNAIKTANYEKFIIEMHNGATIDLYKIDHEINNTYIYNSIYTYIIITLLKKKKYSNVLQLLEIGLQKNLLINFFMKIQDDSISDKSLDLLEYIEKVKDKFLDETVYLKKNVLKLEGGDRTIHNQQDINIEEIIKDAHKAAAIKIMEDNIIHEHLIKWNLNEKEILVKEIINECKDEFKPYIAVKNKEELTAKLYKLLNSFCSDYKISDTDKLSYIEKINQILSDLEQLKTEKGQQDMLKIIVNNINQKEKLKRLKKKKEINIKIIDYIISKLQKKLELKEKKLELKEKQLEILETKIKKIKQNNKKIVKYYKKKASLDVYKAYDNELIKTLTELKEDYQNMPNFLIKDDDIKYYHTLIFEILPECEISISDIANDYFYRIHEISNKINDERHKITATLENIYIFMRIMNDNYDNSDLKKNTEKIIQKNKMN